MTSERLAGWPFACFNLVLGLAHVAVLFNAAAYIAFLPHVAGDLGGVLPSFGTWAQTDFMIALALGFPLARWLAARHGECRVFVGAFVVYAAASWFCAVSQTLAHFLTARVVLGLAGGVTLPIAQSLLLQEYPDRLKSLALGVWGFFTLMPFTVGLPLGGWIADELGWRHLFHLNVPLGLAIAGTGGALFHGRFRRPSPGQRLRFDYVGFVLLAVIIGGVQTILNQGDDFDWFDSGFLRAVLVLVVAALPIWIVWELGEREPALDLRLFKSRNFTVGLIGLTAGFFALQGLLSLFVVQLQLLLGYSSFLAGMVFLPMILLGLPVIAVMHEVAKRVDVRILASLNLLGFAATFYWIGLYDDPHSFDQIFWPMLLEGLFLGSFFAPLTVLTLHGMSGAQVLRAAETANFLRIAAGALGITVQAIILFRRTPFHQLHLADHFGGRVSLSYDPLQQLMARLEAAGLEPGMIQRKLGLLMKQQAALLAMADAFLAASFLCLGLAAFVWLARTSVKAEVWRQK